MSLRKSFGLNKNLASEGKWFDVDVDENDKPMRFKLLYMNAQNKNLSKIKTSVMKPYKRQIDQETISDALLNNVGIEIFVRGVLVDWDNIVVEDGGKPLEFNEENATMIMKEFPELFTLLLLLAKDFGNFKQAEVEDIAKNL